MFLDGNLLQTNCIRGRGSWKRGVGAGQNLASNGWIQKMARWGEGLVDGWLKARDEK